MSTFQNHDFKNERALIRVDFNVPVKNGEITDDTRIRAAMPTINKVLADGGSVVLMSHWGRPLKDIEKKHECVDELNNHKEKRKPSAHCYFKGDSSEAS